MASSTRDQVMDAVIAALTAITAGGTYVSTVAHVSDQKPPSHPEQIDLSKLPACFPIDADEQQDWIALKSATLDIGADLTVIVSCVVFNLEATGLRHARTNLMRDVTKAILNDTTILGLCTDVNPGEIRTDQGYFENYSTWDQYFTFGYYYDSSVGG